MARYGHGYGWLGLTITSNEAIAILKRGNRFIDLLCVILAYYFDHCKRQNMLVIYLYYHF